MHFLTYNEIPLCQFVTFKKFTIRSALSQETELDYCAKERGVPIVFLYSTKKPFISYFIGSVNTLHRTE